MVRNHINIRNVGQTILSIRELTLVRIPVNGENVEWPLFVAQNLSISKCHTGERPHTCKECEKVRLMTREVTMVKNPKSIKNVKGLWL